MKKIKLAVLFGGVSSEHEVSLLSVTSILKNIHSEKYELLLVGITKDGRWLRYAGDIDHIASGAWESDPSCTPAILSPDRSQHGFLIHREDRWETVPVDCVFPVLHGKNGEDGSMQGFFTVAGIPFVGCGVLASACCMDKDVTHTMLKQAGIRTADWRTIRKPEFEKQEEKILLSLEEAFDYPMFVKPANAGSSVGITKAKDRASLKSGLKLAFLHDGKAVVEKTITGMEVETAVLGNGETAVAEVGQIIPGKEFYDYEDKYLSDQSQTRIPADLDQPIRNEIRETAARAYRLLGCEGFCRVDFFVTEQKEIILNEPNTIPGFTAISMYPKLWEHCGLSYGDLIDRLVTLALERTDQ